MLITQEVNFSKIKCQGTKYLSLLCLNKNVQDKPIHMLCQVTSLEHSANRSTYSIIFYSSSNLSEYHLSFYTYSQLPHDLPDLFTSTHSANGEGTGNSLQYSCLENPMAGGAWQAAVHGVSKSRTRLSDFTFTFHFHALEKEMATHPSVLAWRIPGTGEPGGCHLWGRTEPDTTEGTSSSSILPKLYLKIKYIFIPSQLNFFFNSLPLSFQ